VGCNCLECNYNNFFKSSYLKNKLSLIVNKEINTTGEIFSSYYRAGDFLGKHSDKDNGEYAFVYQLSKNWDVKWGGNLYLLKDDWQEVDKTIVPKFNQMILFSVENSKRPHFVSHILPDVTEKRFSITGWYNSKQALNMMCS
jgi:Rps23 Pro-64 3,4-dihydroxylase Tpa1-like proline 4-hydroxylase